MATPPSALGNRRGDVAFSPSAHAGAETTEHGAVGPSVYDSGESCALQGDHRESSLLLTVTLLMLCCCGAMHLGMARVDAAGQPRPRPLR